MRQKASLWRVSTDESDEAAVLPERQDAVDATPHSKCSLHQETRGGRVRATTMNCTIGGRLQRRVPREEIGDWGKAEERRETQEMSGDQPLSAPIIMPLDRKRETKKNRRTVGRP
jgi:hypothetical protein